jgi:hypothetical protein
MHDIFANPEGERPELSLAGDRRAIRRAPTLALDREPARIRGLCRPGAHRICARLTADRTMEA